MFAKVAAPAVANFAVLDVGEAFPTLMNRKVDAIDLTEP